MNFFFGQGLSSKPFLLIISRNICINHFPNKCRDSAARWSAAVNDDGKHRTYEAVSSVTSLLHRYFPGTAIYPIVGGADVYPRGQTYFKNSHDPYQNLATLWYFLRNKLQYSIGLLICSRL